MKTLMLTLALLLSLLLSLLTGQARQAAGPGTGYGKVTPEEISQTLYPADTAAAAVILNHIVDGHYQYETGFRRYTTHYFRIKIMKPEGIRYAQVAIPYFSGTPSIIRRDYVDQVKARSSSLENGQIVTTEMKRNEIAEQRLSSELKQIRFTIPDVKAGSIIEYQYTEYSDRYDYIPDLYLQFGIPVAQGFYRMRIPEIFNFNISNRAPVPVEMNTGTQRESFQLRDGNSSKRVWNFISHIRTFTTQHVPALRDAPHTWCKNDYRGLINFELHSMKLPKQESVSRANTWVQVEDELDHLESFGGRLQLELPFIEELSDSVKQKVKINRRITRDDKIQLAFRMLKSKMSWNGEYNLYSHDIKSALQNKSGSNADMNFVLINMLREMGVSAFPLLMSHREKGRLPTVYPTLNKINTFVVGVKAQDGSMTCLDGSMTIENIGLLPPELLVEDALVYTHTGTTYWVNLQKESKSSMLMQIDGRISADGTLTGTRTTQLEGQFARLYRNRMQEAGNPENLKKKIEKEQNITLRQYTATGIDTPLAHITETAAFQTGTGANGELRFNPLLFPPFTQSPYRDEPRDLPAEKDYPYTIRITADIEIPDGYDITQLPKAARINYSDQGDCCLYNIRQNGNRVQLSYTLTLKQLIYYPKEYSDFCTYWKAVAGKNSETVVLKKK